MHLRASGDLGLGIEGFGFRTCRERPHWDTIGIRRFGILGFEF